MNKILFKIIMIIFCILCSCSSELDTSCKKDTDCKYDRFCENGKCEIIYGSIKPNPTITIPSGAICNHVDVPCNCKITKPPMELGEILTTSNCISNLHIVESCNLDCVNGFAWQTSCFCGE